MTDKKYHIILISLLVILIFLTVVCLTKSNNNIYAETILVVSNEKTATEKKINETNEKDKYKVNIYYPYTEYSNLNTHIEDKIKEVMNEFIKTSKDAHPFVDRYYTLDINYEKYQYQNYITYLFRIFVDTQGAHPNSYLYTISYNTTTKEIVSIDTLVKQNKDILKKLSTESRSILSANQELNIANDNVVKKMMLEGTQPTKDNFRNFAYTPKGLLVFFERYQVAPYSYGEFTILIPYDKLLTL